MKLLWTLLIHLALFVILAAILICILLFTGSDSCDKAAPTLEGYKNHQLIQFTPYTARDAEKLVQLQEKLSLIPWTDTLKLGEPFMLQVPPDQTKGLASYADGIHLPFRTLSSNLQDYLTNQKKVITEFKLEKSSDFDLNRFHDFDEIEKYLNKIAEENSDKVVLNSYGSSIENRKLYYVHITNGKNTAQSADKIKQVVFECGVHSREWISPAACLHFIDYLINDQESKSLLDEYSFYILPCINPDGYAYSWSTDRMWRKNRRRFQNNCYGVDLNRNFNVGFNASKSIEHTHPSDDMNESSNRTLKKRDSEDSTAAEPAQCSNLYGGERPYSENESFYLKRFIDRFTNKPRVYVSLHSYSQMWLYPHGTAIVSSNDSELEHYAKIGVENLHKSRENGTEWKYGRVNAVLYNAGGISIDWVHKDAGIELVYALEMRDSETYGFLLPDNEIEPASKEAWTGIKAMLESYAKDLKERKNNVTESTNTIETESETTTTEETSSDRL